MSPPTSRELAERLVAREQASGGAPGDATTATERAIRRLCLALAGWFGPYAVHALLTRAVAQAHAVHPALVAVRAGPPPARELTGLFESLRAHAGPAIAAGALDVLTALIELLSHLIGDDLATGLVERTLRDGGPIPDGPMQDGPGPDALRGAPAARAAAERAPHD